MPQKKIHNFTKNLKAYDFYKSVLLYSLKTLNYMVLKRNFNTESQILALK